MSKKKKLDTFEKLGKVACQDTVEAILFDYVDSTTIYIYDFSTGKGPETEDDGLMGNIKISEGDEDKPSYPLFNLQETFTVANLKAVIEFGVEYAKKFDKVQKELRF